METIGFDNQKYIAMQSEAIIERIERFNNKLYLEFGGKLFDDYHASRVLPGFDPNGKALLLKKLADKAEVIFSISAIDIEKKKIRADFGITYDLDVLRIIDSIRSLGIYVSNVVITQYTGQPAATTFYNKLSMRGEKISYHTPIKGYPSDIDYIVSDEGFGANPYIETTRPLVIVTAPGPGSGKLATCLSQMYHENKQGRKAGYAKFETFPVHNLPLTHPVNLAYEAATADLRDVNMIDPFHLEAYGKTAVNYNRDIEVFPIVKSILTKITGEEIYKSPTDMGVNMAGNAITDDELIRKVAKNEISRRYYAAWCDYMHGRVDAETPKKIELIMQQLDIKPEDRCVVSPALEKVKNCGTPVVSIGITDEAVITGKSSPLMSCAASATLNAIKRFAGIPDEALIIAPDVLAPIVQLKEEIYQTKSPHLTLEEILIALAISAATDATAKRALDNLGKLRGLEAHSSSIIPSAEENMLKKLGLQLTSEPEFPTKDLFYM